MQWRRLRQLVGSDWILLVCGVVFLACAAVSDVCVPHFSSQALNAIVASAAGDADRSVKAALVGLTAASGGAALFSGLRGATFWLAGTRVVSRLRTAMFDNLVSQEIAYFDKTQRGILTSRLTSDATKVADVVSFNLNILMRQSIQTIGGVAYLFWIDGYLASVAVGWMVFAALLTDAYGKFARKCSRRTQDAVGVANAVADEALENVRVVRSFSAEKVVAARYAQAVAVATTLQKAHGIGYGVSRVALGVARAASTVSVLALGDARRAAGLLDAEKLVSFIFYSAFVNGAAFDVGDQLAKVEEALGAGAAAFDLANRQPTWSGNAPPGGDLPARENAAQRRRGVVDTAAGAATKKEEEEKQPSELPLVELRNVTFAYPARPMDDVLREVSVQVPRNGGKIALVGTSGSGKSSVTRLVLRHYETQSGAVFLDGEDVRDVPQRELARRVAYVEQEPRLFDGTIADNIRFGLDEATDPLAHRDRVERVAKLAGVSEFADRLPDKLDTRVGAAGAFQSGGQRARVAIARALLRDPDLIVLDEPTSALDAVSEEYVQRALDAVNASTLTVAHRLATIQNCDNIYVMNNGSVIESGTHDRLLAINGAYAAMVEQQNLAAGEGTSCPPKCVDEQLATPQNDTVVTTRVLKLDNATGELIQQVDLVEDLTANPQDEEDQVVHHERG